MFHLKPLSSDIACLIPQGRNSTTAAFNIYVYIPISPLSAFIAQWLDHNLAKLHVSGSNPTVNCLWEIYLNLPTDAKCLLLPLGHITCTDSFHIINRLYRG